MISIEEHYSYGEIIDKSLIHLQYIQAVFNVITGNYAVSEELVLLLGAIHFLIKFGKYEEEYHEVGFLGEQIIEYIPFRLIKKGIKSLDQWEYELFQTVRYIYNDPTYQLTAENELLFNMNGDYLKSIDNPQDIDISLTDASNDDGDDNADHLDRHIVLLKYLYLKNLITCESCNYTFFPFKVKSSRFFPENCILGIHHQGIGIFDRQRILVKKFIFAEISEWGYDEENKLFYFEFKTAEGYFELIELPTVAGSIMCDLLTDYALSYMKEKDQIKLREANYKARMALLRKHRVYDEATKAAAATKLQAHFRGYSFRMRWLREDCAILIQCVYRGYVTRKRVREMIARLIEEGQIVIE